MIPTPGCSRRVPVPMQGGWILLAWLIACSEVAISQEATFVPGVPFARGEPGIPRVADLNGDGHVDLVFEDYWMENIAGTGEFADPVILFDGTLLFVGDLDGDEDPDLATVRHGGWGYDWRENDGTGQFPVAHTISSASGIPGSTYAVADLDGDEDLDILVGSASTDQLRWLRNTDGLGSFELAQTISAAADYISSIAAGDLDGDGDLDIAAALRGDNRVVWFENLDGQGQYDFLANGIGEPTGASCVRVAHMNADPFLDVIASGSGSVCVYLFSDTEAGFQLADSVGVEAYDSSLECQDLDADGDPDILVALNQQYDVMPVDFLWIGNALQSDGLLPHPVGMPYHKGIDAFCVADLYGDPGHELVSWTYNHPVSIRSFNQETLAFGPPVLPCWGPLSGRPGLMDFDADGDPDVLDLAASESNGPRVYSNGEDGPGALVVPELVSPGGLFDTNHELAYGDFDGDGNLDIAAFGLAAETEAWITEIHWSNGAGGYEVEVVPQAFDAENCYGQLQTWVEDFDNDGDLDLACKSDVYSSTIWGLVTLKVLLNDRDAGQFVQGPVFGGEGTILDFGDFDSDGDLDLLFYDEMLFGLNLRWYGFGQGGWISGGQVIPVNGGQYSARACDLDGDGDMDVLNEGSDDLSWSINLDGNGTFLQMAPLISNQNFNYYTVADPDSDGHAEVIVSFFSQDELRVFEFDGTSVSSRMLAIEPPMALNEPFTCGDLDQDGLVDLIGANHWYLQDQGTGMGRSVEGTRVKGSGELRVHPNPFNQNTLLSFEVYQPGSGTLDIYNMQGQKVHGATLSITHPGTQQIPLTTGLSSGVYLARVRFGGRSITGTIIQVN